MTQNDSFPLGLDARAAPMKPRRSKLVTF